MTAPTGPSGPSEPSEPSEPTGPTGPTGPALPAAIGRYRIIEVIGRGATSTVYRAVDDELAADVAVKVMSDHLAVRPELRAGMLREGRALRRVNDRHVMAVHDVGTLADDRPFLVVELIDGGSLEDRLVPGVLAGADDVLRVATQVAAGMRALHSAGIVHADVKPDNLLLDTAGHPEVLDDDRLLPPSVRLVLADGGIAIDAGASALGGTAGYQPPEQAAGQPVDVTADLHAATVIVARALTGAGVRDASGRLRGAVGAWASRAMASDVASRPATSDEWLAQLQDALDQDALDQDALDQDALDQDGRGPDERERDPGDRRGSAGIAGRSGRRWIAGAVAVVALGALGAGIVAVRNDDASTAAVLEARPEEHQVVRLVGDRSTVIAGNGNEGDSGDGGAAIDAALVRPAAAVQTSSGEVLIADAGAHRVRQVGTDGTISTVAGTGRAGVGGEGVPARSSALDTPGGIAVSADGVIYVSDTGNHRVREIRDGVITTIAGTGIAGRSGAGGPALQAQLDEPGVLEVEDVAAPSDRVVLLITDRSGTARLGADGTLTR